MEVDEEERTQHETASCHSLRTSLSLDDLRTALHHSNSPCVTAVSLTRLVDDSERWRQLLGDTMVHQLAGLPNRPESDADVQRALLENVIASIREENVEPSLSTARRHSFQLNDGDSFVLEVPSATLDQYDDPWAPPNTLVDEESLRGDCITTCSTLESISPSASRETIAGEVAQYLLIKGGAWHANVNDSVRVEMATPPPSESESASGRFYYLSMGGERRRDTGLWSINHWEGARAGKSGTGFATILRLRLVRLCSSLR